LPKLLKKKENSELWHMLDTEFKFPKTLLQLRIYTNHRNSYHCPKSIVLRKLWVACFNSEMNSLNYLVEMAKSMFRVWGSPGFVEISGKCYSATLRPYLQKLLEFMDKFKTFSDENLFEDKRNKMITDMKGQLKSPPFRLGLMFYNNYLVDGEFSTEEMIEALEEVDFEEFKKWRHNFLNKVRFEWLLEGNISAEEAVGTVDYFEEHFT